MHRVMTGCLSRATACAVFVVLLFGIDHVAQASFPCQDGSVWKCDDLNVCECVAKGPKVTMQDFHFIMKVNKATPLCLCRDAGPNLNAVGALHEFQKRDDAAAGVRIGLQCNVPVFDEDLSNLEVIRYEPCGAWEFGPVTK